MTVYTIGQEGLGEGSECGLVPLVFVTGSLHMHFLEEYNVEFVVGMVLNYHYSFTLRLNIKEYDQTLV